MKTAAIYTRISEDPKSRGGKAVNVATQERDCRKIAAERGYDVVEVFCDNDLSAADPKVVRPAFEALLERVLVGDFAAVLVYTQDRLVRLPADLERVMGTFTVSSTALIPVVGTSDFQSDEGQLYARFGTMLASYEVAKVRRRVIRKMADNAERGLPSGGGAGYGFRADKVTLEPQEAKRIREAAKRVLDGESLYSIAQRWNDKAVPFRGGRPWNPSAIRRILLAPRIAGLRVHRGEIVGRAVWPEIVDRQTFDRVGKVLTRPSRRTVTDRGQKLLTGLLSCGVGFEAGDDRPKCGKPLNHKTSQKGPRYYCRHCLGTLVAADHVEEFVRGTLAEAVDDREFIATLRRMEKDTGAVDLAEDIDRLEAERGDLAHELAEGRMTAAEWKIVRAGIDARLTTLHAEAARQRGGSPLSEWAGKGGALDAAWPKMKQETKRALIGAAFSDIIVKPARAGFNRFDSDRIDAVAAIG